MLASIVKLFQFLVNHAHDEFEKMIRRDADHCFLTLLFSKTSSAGRFADISNGLTSDIMFGEGIWVQGGCYCSG